MLGIGIFWMVVLVFGPYILGIAVIWLIVYLFGQAQFVAASLVLLAMAVLALAFVFRNQK